MFGEQAENSRGMQVIGKKEEKGYFKKISRRPKR